METEPPKASPAKRKRRWFQFSLRTLLLGVTVLALVCGYVNWQAKTVNKRHDLLKLNYVTTNYASADDYSVWNVRRWMGDYPRQIVCLDTHTPADVVTQFAEVFPEAQISFWTDKR